MNYSIEKIAREFGISKTTVSLIVNGKASENRISEELEEKVKAFCEKVNYTPNIHALRMCSKVVGNIGLLINGNMLVDSENPFTDQIISEITGGVVVEAAKRGFRVTIQLYNETDGEDKVFGWLRNREVDGLIYYGYAFDPKWLKSFAREKRCVVGIGVEPQENVSVVNIDSRPVMREITKTVLKSGRRHIIYVDGVDSYVSRQRFSGVRDALEECNAEFLEKSIVKADFSEKRAYEIFKTRIVDFDAVICANDDMAIGVLRALRERGFEIPEKISITGADNNRSSGYTTPAITTFDNMNTILGKTAVSELKRLIDGSRPRETTIKSKIILRNSI